VYRPPDVATAAAQRDDALFAVLDVETTGFSPLVGDRIVEIAVIRLRPDGSETDEFSTLVNPGREIGASHVHGITEDDVSSAPTFHEVVGDLLERLERVILVAHNAAYDLQFLSAELTEEGVFLPTIPMLCTLKLSYRLHPKLAHHTLAACCAAAGVGESTAHSALDDARVTAQLLVSYIREAGQAGMTIQDLLGCDLVFPAPWPSAPPTRRTVVRSSQSLGRIDPPYLARLVARLASMDTTEASAPYLHVLDSALQDLRLTPAEANALEETATAWGLSAADVVEAHQKYLDALVRTGLADGGLTANEQQDLDDVARLLGVPSGTLDALIELHAVTAIDDKK
jgi:DNA polymerase III epsilon subunit family exonuclease